MKNYLNLKITAFMQYLFIKCYFFKLASARNRLAKLNELEVSFNGDPAAVIVILANGYSGLIVFKIDHQLISLVHPFT